MSVTRWIPRLLILGAASAAAVGVSAGLAAAGTAALVRKRRIVNARKRIQGEVVLITGGSRGLGLALAREFLRADCRVAICARDQDELNRAQKLLRKEGGEIRTFTCDVSDRESVARLIRDVRDAFGEIDVLVNNAGQISVGPIENATIEDFERAMGVMFWGVVYPTLEVLDTMRARRHGRIATITSIGGKVSVPHLLPYCCAKFAAAGFCEGLRAEMAPHGVSVTTIAPGLMRTGGHLNAEFKGNQHAESAWFSVAATLPGLSMSAERAARQTFRAIAMGKSEKILSMQANLLARVNSAFPGVMPDFFGWIGRLLPAATADRESRSRGADLRDDQSGWVRIVTALGELAANRFNQRSHT